MPLDFYQTVGGRRFIEGTVPKLIDELEKLNANLALLNDRLRSNREAGLKQNKQVDTVTPCT